MGKFGNTKQAKEFENLYFENFTRLCHNTYRFIKDEDITKDIVQDVFLKYWQRIHELSIHESPQAYLRRACINEAINYLKEKDRRKNRETQYAEETARTKNISGQPDTIYISDETSRNIHHAIEQLPPVCRTTFLLSRHEQKSSKEIAELLDISVNTVEKHIGKALKTLRMFIRNLH